MKEKVVPSAWLEHEGRRLDCGPHLSGAMEARIRLANLRTKKETLQSLTRYGVEGIFHAGREGRTYVLDETHGVPFLGSTDILSADLSFLPLISKVQLAATARRPAPRSGHISTFNWIGLRQRDVGSAAPFNLIRIWRLIYSQACRSILYPPWCGVATSLKLVG